MHISKFYNQRKEKQGCDYNNNQGSVYLWWGQEAAIKKVHYGTWMLAMIYFFAWALITGCVC